MPRRSGHRGRPSGQRSQRRDPRGPNNGPASARPAAFLRPSSDRIDGLNRSAALPVAADDAVSSEPAAAPGPAAVAPALPGNLDPVAPATPGTRAAPGDTREPSPAPEAQAPRPSGGCTAAQLRRFIKSRAYVPMHELRRRFAINGAEDDVAPVQTDGARIFVGLPARESQLLGELLRSGDIGYELSQDPVSPIVIGVYPMRPVSRS